MAEKVEKTYYLQRAFFPSDIKFSQEIIADFVTLCTVGKYCHKVCL